MSTIVNTKKITNDREAFEAIRDHLISQGDRSSFTDSVCMYRGFKYSFALEMYKKYTQDLYYSAHEDFGSFSSKVNRFRYWVMKNYPNYKEYEASCAVGCLINDENYSVHFESKSVDYADVIDAVLDSNPDWEFNDFSKEMLTHLQNIHDNNSPTDWHDLFYREGAFNFDSEGNFKSFEPLVFDYN